MFDVEPCALNAFQLVAHLTCFLCSIMGYRHCLQHDKRMEKAQCIIAALLLNKCAISP